MITIMNQIEAGKEAVNAARTAMASGDRMIIVYEEVIYYANIADPITSQRKRPYGVKLVTKMPKGYCISSPPRFFKTVENALRAAHEIAFA